MHKSGKLQTAINTISINDISELKDYSFVQRISVENFGDTLQRYLDEKHIDRAMLVRITEISGSSIHKYLRNQVEISLEHTAAICIALRLHPMQSEYLFGLTHVQLNRNLQRDMIILHYLYGCAFSEKFSLENCNNELRNSHFKPLTTLGAAETKW
jgi:hypothetical protein